MKKNKSNKNYKSKNHSKFILTYHIIFVCKYRKKFLIKYGEDIKQIMYDICKRYDFYIPSMSVIIETHGIQHYQERTLSRFKDRFSRTIDEEIANDQYKMNLALSNNIKYYIQLDCRKSELDYIKDSIINSEINNLFDLSTVDWNKCYQRTLTSNVIWCAELWNNGMKRTKDIEEYTGIDRCSIVPYLKKAAKVGLCDFELNYTKNEISNKKDIK